MADLKSVVAEKLPLTMGETIALAKEYGVRVVDVVLTESELRTGLDREGVLKAVMEEYAHNLKAVEIGVSGGNSFLLGTVPTQLKEMGPGTIFADVLLDKALMYTVAAEVGNHCIGVRPCAGTGDPCPYTGFLRALMDVGTDETTLAEVACLMLKVGSLFRVAKVTTGCNLEGYGAGSAAIAAATVHLKNGTPEQMEKAIREHPNAVAVLVNNPTYYGICSDLRAIVKMAHDAGMLCLADEAHGTHFYFGGGLPVSAMAAGADMASVSMHKSGGSLTQSSLLLIGPNVHPGYVRQIINLTQTTSGSYLLMSSLDISRRNLAQRGRQVFHQVADIAEYAREEINAVGGYYAFGKELCNGNSVFDFDTTKLSVHTLDIGLAGIEVYDILRDEYDIQIEFGDIGNILAYLSIGDRPQEVERLVSALAEIKRRYRTDGTGLLSQEYIDPVVATSPQEAFYAPKKSLPLRETVGMVCSEFVMCYPPGIPILAPGERITKEILNYIEYAKAKGCSMTGPEDPDILHLNVLA